MDFLIIIGAIALYFAIVAPIRSYYMRKAVYAHIERIISMLPEVERKDAIEKYLKDPEHSVVERIVRQAD